MCVIFIGTSSAILDLDLRSAWAANPDGAGYVVRRQSDTYVRNGIMTLKALQSSLGKLPDSTEIVLHLRLATHGRVSVENTHPFRMGQTWLFHNGIAGGFGRAGSGKDSESDSAHLARALSRVEHEDRLTFLEHVGGKYAIVDKAGYLWLVGDFSKCSGSTVRASNQHWSWSHRDSWESEYGYGWVRRGSNGAALPATKTVYLDKDTDKVQRAITAQAGIDREHADAIVKAAGRTICDLGIAGDDDDDQMVCS